MANLKLQFWWNTNPRYLNDSTCSMGAPLRVIGIFRHFRAPNTSVLVFSMLTVSPLSSQKPSRRSISRCSPLCVVDISTRSSAYNKSGTASPANDGASVPGTSFNITERGCAATPYFVLSSLHTIPLMAERWLSKDRWRLLHSNYALNVLAT